MSPFKGPGSGVLGTFTVLYNYDLSLVPEIFSPLKGNPMPTKHSLYILLPLPRAPLVYFLAL